MKDIYVIIILALVIGGAIFYIIKSKKKGVKCIGCPNGSNCVNKKDAEDCGGCSK